MEESWPLHWYFPPQQASSMLFSTHDNLDTGYPQLRIYFDAQYDWTKKKADTVLQESGSFWSESAWGLGAMASLKRSGLIDKLDCSSIADFGLVHIITYTTHMWIHYLLSVPLCSGWPRVVCDFTKAFAFLLGPKSFTISAPQLLSVVDLVNSDLLSLDPFTLLTIVIAPIVITQVKNMKVLL